MNKTKVAQFSLFLLGSLTSMGVLASSQQGGRAKLPFGGDYQRTIYGTSWVWAYNGTQATTGAAPLEFSSYYSWPPPPTGFINIAPQGSVYKLEFSVFDLPPGYYVTFSDVSRGLFGGTTQGGSTCFPPGDSSVAYCCAGDINPWPVGFSIIQAQTFDQNDILVGTTYRLLGGGPFISPPERSPGEYRILNPAPTGPTTVTIGFSDSIFDILTPQMIPVSLSANSSPASTVTAIIDAVNNGVYGSLGYVALPGPDSDSFVVSSPPGMRDYYMWVGNGSGQWRRSIGAGGRAVIPGTAVIVATTRLDGDRVWGRGRRPW